MIDSNDLVGTVSAAVQNGLSGDELLRLCESLGKGTMEMASMREVRACLQLAAVHCADSSMLAASINMLRNCGRKLIMCMVIRWSRWIC